MNNYSMKYLIQGLIGHKAKSQAEPRKEIWASDLGKPYIDTYLTMKGEVPTNPADGKGLVTFFLGNQIEKGVGELLQMCGIAWEGQERLCIKNEGCLDVVGRPDFIVEVKNWTEVYQRAVTTADIAKANTIESKLRFRIDEKLKIQLEAIDAFKENYPDGLPKTVFETKSINTQALTWAKKEGLANKYPHHVLQLYTYLIALDLLEGHILYIGKDYGDMEEVVILRSAEMDKKWLDEVKTISNYYLNNIEPEIPLDKKGKVDWRINYSKYKDLLLEKLNLTNKP